MTKSFTDMRLGLFVHYLFFDAVRALAGEPIGRKDDGTVVGSLDELANGLDVEGLADAARTMRAEYVIFTAWHANMNAMFPSCPVCLLNTLRIFTIFFINVGRWI